MKRKSYSEELHRTIESIGHGLKPDWDRENVRGREKVLAGPNRWDEVKDDPKHYGKNFDYRIMDGDVFIPCCVAAQEWVRKQVGETQHWYSDLDGFLGVKMGKGQGYYQGMFLKAAARDGLLSEEEYIQSMSENDNLVRQGE